MNNPGPFHRLISALEPWLDQIVIIGGWAHQLHRLHPDAQAVDYQPLMTLDTDVAVPRNLTAGEQDIRERLLAHGFTEEFLGDDSPPATHYHLGGDASGFYAEFLTPLVGSAHGRGYTRQATANVAGVCSQQLRHIEILLLRPWFVEIESSHRVPIPNPVSFLAQKILIHRARQRGDRAKDVLYMHDTIEIFGTRLAELDDLFRHYVCPSMSPRSINTLTSSPELLFGQVSDDVRRAAEIDAARALSPEAIRQACLFGLSRIFRRVSVRRPAVG